VKVEKMNEVETITGNLLDFPPYHPNDPDKYIGINNIAHSCNTRNIMGGGIAKQIKSRYPQAYEADTEFHMRREHETLEEFTNPLGKYSKAKVTTERLLNDTGTIYNLYTQADIGTQKRQVDYEHFFLALEGMYDDMLLRQSEQPHVVGFPYGISCGLAGGDWGIILEMINSVFGASSSPFKTYVVNYVLS
jgi:O-acetyl-ADP-ribose deacetylase (regulator of RNase III)